jgi:hypothetical protein
MEHNEKEKKTFNKETTDNIRWGTNRRKARKKPRPKNLALHKSGLQKFCVFAPKTVPKNLQKVAVQKLENDPPECTLGVQ